MLTKDQKVEINSKIDEIKAIMVAASVQGVIEVIEYHTGLEEDPFFRVESIRDPNWTASDC